MFQFPLFSFLSSNYILSFLCFLNHKFLCFSILRVISGTYQPHDATRMVVQDFSAWALDADTEFWPRSVSFTYHRVVLSRNCVRLDSDDWKVWSAWLSQGRHDFEAHEIDWVHSRQYHNEFKENLGKQMFLKEFFGKKYSFSNNLGHPI